MELLFDPIVASLEDLGVALWSKKAPELVTSKGPRPLNTGSCTAVGWEYTEGVSLDNMASAESVDAGGAETTPPTIGDNIGELEGAKPLNS